MFFTNKFNFVFGLNLTFVYKYTICMAWRFHFPIRKYDFKVYSSAPNIGFFSCHHRHYSAIVSFSFSSVLDNVHDLHRFCEPDVGISVLITSMC